MGKPPKPVLLGGQSVQVPALAAPVGVPDRKYPNINQPQAALQVDTELAKLAELKNPPQGAGGLTPTLLRIAIAVAGYRQNRVGAIAGFMQTTNVGTDEERQKNVILPDGEAWRWLFAYGHMANALDTLRDDKKAPRDYVYTGSFDHQKFLTEASSGLRGNVRTKSKFSPLSLSNFDRFLGFMEVDGRIVDVRWMAYMFATAFWESARVVVTGKRPNGRDIKNWETVIPIEETGKGEQRAYARPVKIDILGSNKVQATEWDGEVFEKTNFDPPKLVQPSTTVDPKSRYFKKPGSDYKDGDPAVSVYKNAAGLENVYFGRGYVQLTWWYHYMSAGLAIGRGLDLLKNPASADDPDIAYKVMSDGMITGRHYANGLTLGRYIYGGTCNYAGARAIVNASDPEPAIVDAAHIFEAALLKARK